MSLPDFVAVTASGHAAGAASPAAATSAASADAAISGASASCGGPANHATRLRYPSTSFKEGNSYALEAGTAGGHAAAQTTPAAAIPKAPTAINLGASAVCIAPANHARD